MRKAIQIATISLSVKEYTDDAGLVHIDIVQTATPGSQTTTEERTLNWDFAEHTDKVFGKLRGKTRFVKVAELEESYLKNGWDQKFLDEGEGEVVQNYVESISSTWTANQTWGFEVIDGQRRYTRHVHAKKGKEEHRIKLVYDWRV